MPLSYPSPSRLLPSLLYRSLMKTDSFFWQLFKQLIEELLVRKFAQLDREEIRRMFHLSDLKETKAWKQIWQEGREEGRTKERQENVQRWLAEGKSEKEIAELLNMSVREVRRLAKR
jgi:predicted transposase YdaD